MKQIVIFGDSITYGAWDRNGGWADNLRKYFHAGFLDEKNEYTLIYNLGIPGDNTREAAERIKLETENRLDEGTKATFLIAYGVNDSAFEIKKNSFRVSKNEFVNNLEKITNNLKPWAEKIIFLSIAPVIEKITAADTNAERIRKNSFIEEYNNEIKKFCESQSFGFIDIYSEFLKNGLNEVLCAFDGLHPNEKGHRLIFAAVKNFL